MGVLDTRCLSYPGNLESFSTVISLMDNFMQPEVYRQTMFFPLLVSYALNNELCT